jgi:hypothetical protein
LSEHEIPADIAALSFEEALKQLEELVRQLEKAKAAWMTLFRPMSAARN